MQRSSQAWHLCRDCYGLIADKHARRSSVHAPFGVDRLAYWRPAPRQTLTVRAKCRSFDRVGARYAGGISAQVCQFEYWIESGLVSGGKKSCNVPGPRMRAPDSARSTTVFQRRSVRTGDMRSSDIGRLVSHVLFVTLVAPQAIAQAYKWVDEAGAVHYGDVLPPRYRSAQQLKGMPAPPSSAESQAAKLRTEREALRAKELSDRRQNAARRQADADPVAEAFPVPDSETPCQKAWRDFESSRACFDSYRLKNRAIHSEAHENCEVVVKPLHDCK